MSEDSPTDPSPSSPATSAPATEPTPPPTPPQEAEPSEPETFPRTYVEGLRTEAAQHRTTARDATTRADTLASAYTAALVRGTGRLADPTDLPLTDALLGEDGLPNEEKIAAAIDDLLAAKPHLASRRPVGSVGQGARPNPPTQESLGDMIRRAAGTAGR